MTALAGTELNKPGNGESFEIACTVLWRCILNNEVKRYGRLGQNQDGIDHYGYRAPLTGLVAIQCKKRDYGKPLTEAAFRGFVARALDDDLPFTEFYICTTAPDDSSLDRIAIEISLEQQKKGRNVQIHHWGWQTIQERAKSFKEAVNAFDPTYGPGAQRIEAKIDDLPAKIETMLKVAVSTAVSKVVVDTSSESSVERHVDAEINGYRALSEQGKPKAAKELLFGLLSRLDESSSGRIYFRVKATIAHCYFATGDLEEGKRWLQQAIAHAPDEPKAISNQILLLILDERYQEAFELAQKTLAGDKKTANAAALLIQAGSQLTKGSVGNPIDFIPSEFLDTKEVFVAQISFLRLQNEREAWWEKAATAFKKYPDDPVFEQLKAEAELDAVLTGLNRKLGVLSSSDRDAVGRAAEVLTRRWRKFEQSEIPATEEAISALSNALVAHAVLENRLEVRALIDGAISAGQTGPVVMQTAAAAACELGEFEVAKRCIELLPDTPEANVHRVGYAMATGRFEEVSRIVESGQLPPEELHTVKLVPKLIVLVGQNSDEVSSSWAALIDKTTDARSLVLIGTFALNSSVPNVPEAALGAAIAVVDSDAVTASERAMVAEFAFRMKEWRKYISLASPIVSILHDNENLRKLAVAHANAFPVEKKSKEFFEKLPEDIGEKEFFKSCVASLLFNSGNVEDAAKSFKAAFDQDATSAHAVLGQIRSLQRLGRSQEVSDLLASVNLETLVGVPTDLMSISIALREVGRFADAISYGYRLLVKYPKHSEVALAYTGLIIGDRAHSIVPKVEIVETGCWFSIKNGNDERRAFYLGDEAPEGFGDVIPLTHPIAVGAFGRAVGDSFELTNALGISEKWSIVEIKSKYLAAFHDTMENFERRFPHAGGLVRMSVGKDGDIQALLQIVRNRSEATKAAVETYAEGKTTLGILCRQLGGNPIDLSAYIRSLDKDIKTCIGTVDEREAAMNVAEASKGKGVIVDLYSVWSMDYAGLLPNLKAWFDRILIPASVIGTFDEIIAELEASLGSSGGVLGWKDGRHIFVESNDDLTRSRLEHLRGIRSRVLAECEVIPPLVSSDVPDKIVSAAELIGGGVFDPLFLCIGEELPLLSEEQVMREAARESGIVSTWIQPTLMALKKGGQFSDEQYAKALVKLGELRHAHLTLDIPTLVSVFRQSTDRNLVELATVSRYLWGKNADLPSHLFVVMGSLKDIWSGHRNPPLRVRVAIHLLLENLLLNHRRKAAGLIASLSVGLRSISGASEYIERWAKRSGIKGKRIRNEKGKVVQKARRSSN